VFPGRTAAWLHGLDLPPCDPVEVTVLRQAGVSARAGLSVSRASLGDDDVVLRRGIPVTSILRTTIDLGSRPPLEEAVVAVDMALQRRLVELAHLREYVETHSRRGVVHLRRAVELAEPSSESAMETRLRLLLVLAGLPRPRAQVPLHDEGGRFLGRPDLYYPEQRLGLEYDGATHRNSLVEDNRRQNRLQDAGYRLLRFTAADILRTPDAVVALVARQLG
jgi:very-short-patch-repair endonuclease